MGIINLLNIVPTFAMKISSSIFSSGSASSFIAASVSNESMVSVIFTFLAKAFYFVGKWMLYLLDIIFSYIQQLCGLNMSFESLEKMVSQESDLVFNLLITSKNTITPIIKNLIGLAVALILFFAMIAVVRNIYNSSKNGGPADIKGVARDTIKAFVLLIITPMLAIVGIIASNLILQSLYHATNTSNSTSVSTQLFSASSMSANSYRIYAQNGGRIPIVFDFTAEKEILDYYANHEVTDEFRKYIVSNDNKIYKTQQIFENETFDEFNILNDVLSHGTGSIEDNVADYYSAYDRNKSAYEAIKNGKEKVEDKYKRIQAYKTEYLVMADVVQYNIETGVTFYYKTIQEVLKSIAQMGDADYFNSFCELYNVELYNMFDRTIGHDMHTFTNATWNFIKYTSTYYDSVSGAEPDRKMDIEYCHVRGQTDELDGAKYIIAVEQQRKIGGVTYSYFYPLTEGFTTGTASGFNSEFIQSGQIISAKGIFSEGKYPTAIKQNKDGSEVQFYRENISDITVGDTSSVADGSLKNEEEESSGGFFGAIGSFFKKLISIFNPVANMNLKENAIVNTYTSEMVTVNILSSGKLSMSYMFSDAFTSGIGAVVNSVRSVMSGGSETEQLGVFGLNLSNVFVPNKINVLVLIVGAFLLLKISLSAVFMLINRAYELFLIIMIYPTACATLPFDNKGYQQWTKSYIQRLFSTYGLILGINFVMMLFPIISEIEFFSAADIAMSKPLMRFRNLFNATAKVATLGTVQSAVSIDFLAKFLNLIVVILFELVAFTLLETLPDTIAKITGASLAQGIDPVATLGKVTKVMSGIIKTLVTGVGGIKDILLAMIPTKNNKSREKIKEKIKERADKALEGVKGVIPGSEIVRSAKDMKHMHDKKKDQKEAMQKLQDTLKDGGSEKDVQNAFNEVLKTQQAYTSAINDPRSSRMAEEREKKEDEKLGLNSRDGDEEDDDEESGFKSKRELKKEKKKADKIVKRLNKKAEKEGGLSKEEQASLDRNKALSEKRKNQIGSRMTSKDYENAKNRQNELNNKKANGETLTEDEQKELDQLDQSVAQYENIKQNTSVKGRISHAVDLSKKRRTAQKEHEKEVEMHRAFRRFDGRSRRAQYKYMKDIEKDMSQALGDFSAATNGGDINDLMKIVNVSDEDFQKYLDDKYQGTAKEKEAAKAYRDKLILQQQLLGENEASQSVQARKQQNLTKYRNRRINPQGRIAKRVNASRDVSNAQKLADVQAKLDAIQQNGGPNSANIDEYNRLNMQKHKLESQRQYYQENSTKTKKQINQERANRAQREMWEREAMEELEEDGEPFDFDKIQKIVERKRQEFLRKKNKKKKY